MSNRDQLPPLSVAASVLDGLIKALPTVIAEHGLGTPLHGLLAPLTDWTAACLFSDPEGPSREFGPFGEIKMPYLRLGAVDTVDILNFDEIVLFAFYWCNRHRYRHVADLGANVGWHSLLLDRCGYEVRAWEPDPMTYGELSRTLELNGCTHVTPINRAVSTKDGTARFVRVVGNRTSSHLEGAKAHPYGELERFDVTLDAYAPIAAWADLVKIDIEGHEAELLCSTDADAWDNTDVVAEIGTPENAERIFAHLSRLGVGIFCQRLGWKKAVQLEELPTHYSHGSVFLSKRNEMPWSDNALV